ncbi:MAG: type II toxin-antitoxin system VapC family toxin [Coriobacteriia bacterium]|nr:type II toxin-antitoxin system VapC family toxin [Coriobacteriia bacterium]
MKANRFLLDTDVIIEYLRGRDKAIRYVESLEGELCVSAITVAELYSGVKDSDEEAALERFLDAFEVISIDRALARLGGLCRQRYQPAHGTGLADAIVAASAESAGAALVTFNKRHFPMSKDVVVPYTRS